VLGSLVEKEATVPDTYPLTLNSVRSACNQTSNRHPVVNYDERTVLDALASLKDRRLVRFVHPAHGERATKYRHVLNETWSLEPGPLATLALLLLRGPQTPAELRARMERYAAAGSSVHEALATLAQRDEPFVTELPRLPGQKEQRWAHLLEGDVRVEDLIQEAPAGGSRSSAAGRLEELDASVQELRRLVEHLYDVLDEARPTD